MNTTYFDATVNDKTRREQLYSGDLFCVFGERECDGSVCFCARNDPGSVWLNRSPEGAIPHAGREICGGIWPNLNPNSSIIPNQSTRSRAF